MKRTFVILITFITLTGCAHQDEWTRANTMMELSYQVAHVYDTIETAKIHERPGLGEANPVTQALIGEQPKERDVYIWAVSTSVSHYLISRALPAKWRKWWQGTTALASANQVWDNKKTYEEWKEGRANGMWDHCSYPEC